MFKKSNRNFRTKKAEFDSDEEEKSKGNRNEFETSSFDQLRLEKIEANNENSSDSVNKVVKSSTQKFLSFEEEQFDEETEFKVRKSKESRRIAKEMKRSRKEKQKQLKAETNGVDSKSELKKPNEELLTGEEVLFNEGIKVKPLNFQQTKKVSKFIVKKYNEESADEEVEFAEFKKNVLPSDSSNDEDESSKIQRLRREMETLNGDDTEKIEEETDETKRSMKLILKSGIIPDASMIHAARKRREMARQGDYIPIENNRPDRNKSRVVREDDENDISDEDASQSRLSLNFVQSAHIERQKIRDNFLSYEQGSDADISDEEKREEDDDDEDDRWEKEQIRKGVQITQGFQSKIELESFGAKGKAGKKMIEHILGSKMDPEPMEIELKMINLTKLSSLGQISFLGFKNAFIKNIALLEESSSSHRQEHRNTLERMNAGASDLERFSQQKPSYDNQYIFYQETKSFLTDFVDCYNEKIEEVEKAESEWMGLLKQRADLIIARRQDDIRDMSIEYSGGGAKKVIDSLHRKRIIAREQRFLLKREKRKETDKENNEGFSSDDEQPEEDVTLFNVKRSGILSELNKKLVSDLNEDFYRIDLIKERFEKWRSMSAETYTNAYVGLSLPKLFSPLIRFCLVDWNPLETENGVEYLEGSSWFRELITLNREETLIALIQEDNSKLEGSDDLLLVPHIIEKTVVLRLLEVVEKLYDPISKKQTSNLSKLVSQLIQDYPTLNHKSANTKKLIEAIISRIKRCIEFDIYVPLFSKQTMENKESGANLFFNRQFWAAVKLYCNVLKWKGILSDKVVKEFALDCLLGRYLMIGLQSAEANLETIRKIEFIIKQIPTDWLYPNLEISNMPQIANMSRLIKRVTDSIYQSEVKANQMNRNTFSELLSRARKLLVSLGAVEQALNLSAEFELNL